MTEPSAKSAYPLWPVLLVASIVAATTLLSLQSVAVEVSPEAGVIMSLPQDIDRFLGMDQDVSEAEKVILPQDTKFAKKLYADGHGDTVNCQIVLSGAEKRSIHRPEYCLPGQGWNIKSTQVIPVQLANGKVLKVTKLLISRPIEAPGGQKGEITSCYLYWFVGKDYTTPSHLSRQLRTTWDRVAHRVNHRWAYVIASALVTKGFKPGGKDEQQTTEMLQKFITDLAPTIMKSEGAVERP